MPNLHDLVTAMKSRIKYDWLSRCLCIFYYLTLDSVMMDSHRAVAGTVKIFYYAHNDYTVYIGYILRQSLFSNDNNIIMHNNVLQIQ